MDKVNGVWKYSKNAPDIHAIYGYLEVDRVLDIQARDSVPTWAKYHPHIKGRREYGEQRNSVYLATDTFSIYPHKPGWGSFKYSPQLVLTKGGAKTKSLWELPPCFQDEQSNFTHAFKIWDELQNGSVEMQTIGRGDEIKKCL